jgi:carboxylesterase type B
VFGTLDSRKGVPWEPIDRTLSDAMTSYWAAFARTGDPSVKGLPAWPKYSSAKGPVLHLDETIRAAPEAQRGRYEALDTYMGRPR